MRSRSTSLRFFSRCTWIRSELGEFCQCQDRRVEIAVFLLQAGKLRTQFTFFLFRHHCDGTEDPMVPITAARMAGQAAINPLKVRRIC